MKCVTLSFSISVFFFTACLIRAVNSKKWKSINEVRLNLCDSTLFTAAFGGNGLPGNHSEWVPPDTIPNSEVKLLSADGSTGFPRARVGHCQASKSKPLMSNHQGFFFISLSVWLSMVGHWWNASVYFPQRTTCGCPNLFQVNLCQSRNLKPLIMSGDFLFVAV